MGVYKYSGKRDITYGIDYYFNGERIREKVGPNKKDAQEREASAVRQRDRGGRYICS
jgi:hypothetical protein